MQVPRGPATAATAATATSPKLSTPGHCHPCIPKAELSPSLCHPCSRSQELPWPPSPLLQKPSSPRPCHPAAGNCLSQWAPPPPGPTEPRASYSLGLPPRSFCPGVGAGQGSKPSIEWSAPVPGGSDAPTGKGPHGKRRGVGGGARPGPVMTAYPSEGPACLLLLCGFPHNDVASLGLSPL